MKKIFVGGPIQYAISGEGNFRKELRNLIEKIITDLLSAGHTVLSAHRYENYGEMDVTNKQAEVCARDFAWMNDCDLFVAVLPGDEDGFPVRSDGTCVELGWASSLGKKVIILRSSATQYSHLVAGLAAIANASFVDCADVLNGSCDFIGIANEVLVSNAVSNIRFKGPDSLTHGGNK